MALGFQIGNLVRTLSHYNFGLYVAGSIASLVGTWMHRVATGWLTWEMTGSAGWLGLIAFADLFPSVLIAPFAGVAADRWDRHRMMKLAQSAGGVAAALLAVLYFLDALNIWGLLAITLVLGVMDSFVQPFRLAFTAGLVPKDELAAAVAIKSVTFNLARFLGPALAGFIIAGWGVGWAFVANALSFIVFLVTLCLIHIDASELDARTPAKAGLLSEAFAGIKYAFSSSGIGAVVVLLLATCLAGRPVVELLPGWAAEIFSGGAGDLAALTSSIGIGAVAGGLWLAGRPSPEGLTRAFLICSLGLSLSLIGFSSSSHTYIAIPMMVVMGFFLVTSAICAQTLIQVNVEDGMRGRVLSVYAIVLRGGPALGALIMGFAAEHFGLRLPLIVGALVLLAVSAVAWTRLTALTPALEGKLR